MRIFITGAGGFVGKNLLPRLTRENHQMLLLARDRRESELLKKHRAKVVVGNLKDIKKIKNGIQRFKPEICIHLAWEGIPDYSPAQSRKNLENSINLVDLIVTGTSCRKIIVSGTCFEYGEEARGICREADSVALDSYISWAKCSLYNYARLICEDAGVDLVWFRMFYVYGPGQRKDSLIPSFVKAFQSKKTPRINSPFNANDFVYVGDVARAMHLAIRKRVKSGIYNLGSGRSSRVIDVCEAVEKCLSGKNAITGKIRKNVSRARRRAVNFWADISKAKKFLGWSPKTTLGDGIREYIKSAELG